MDRTQQAELLKALAEPARLHIMQLLKERQRAMSVEEIATATGLLTRQSGYHLRQLKAAGLLSRQQRRQQAFYRVEERGIIEAYSAVFDLLPQERVAG